MPGKKEKKKAAPKAVSSRHSKAPAGAAEQGGTDPESISDSGEVILTTFDNKQFIVEANEEVPFGVLYMVYEGPGGQKSGTRPWRRV